MWYQGWSVLEIKKTGYECKDLLLDCIHLLSIICVHIYIYDVMQVVVSVLSLSLLLVLLVVVVVVVVVVVEVVLLTTQNIALTPRKKSSEVLRIRSFTM